MSPSRGAFVLRVLSRNAQASSLYSTFKTHVPKSNKKWNLSQAPQSQRNAAKFIPESQNPDASPNRRWNLPRFLPNHPSLRAYIMTFLGVAPPLLFLLLHSPIEVMNVNGPSMAPLFNPNSGSDLPLERSDRVLVQRYKILDPNLYRKKLRGQETDELKSKYERGQIVVFRTPHDPERLAVKRIVGIQGDIVQPLSGYPGGSEQVVVPFNHIWVEGDANERSKSVDSNWYGPISQNLVVGEVKVLFSPWYRPHWVEWRTHKYPALQAGRVQENAVADASVDPNVVSMNKAWDNGQNRKVLKLLKDRPDFAKANFAASSKQRETYREFYRNALLVYGVSEDERKRELAKEVIKAMEEIFSISSLRAGMRTAKGQSKQQEGLPTSEKPPHEEKDEVPTYFGAGDVKVHADKNALAREARARPASVQLKEALERSRLAAIERDEEAARLGSWLSPGARFPVELQEWEKRDAQMRGVNVDVKP